MICTALVGFVYRYTDWVGTKKETEGRTQADRDKVGKKDRKRQESKVYFPQHYGKN